MHYRSCPIFRLASRDLCSGSLVNLRVIQDYFIGSYDCATVLIMITHISWPYFTENERRYNRGKNQRRQHRRTAGGVLSDLRSDRTVIATRRFHKGEHVLNYSGEIISKSEALIRETIYDESPDPIGSYKLCCILITSENVTREWKFHFGKCIWLMWLLFLEFFVKKMYIHISSAY